MPVDDGGSTAVLFDLDGTLVDSFPGIASAYHHMLQAVDLKDIPDSEIRPLVGQNIKAVLHEHFGLSGESARESSVGLSWRIRVPRTLPIFKV